MMMIMPMMLSDDILSFTPPSEHGKYTFLTVEERAEVYGPEESSAQPQSLF